MWSFINHSNLLICCLRNISSYYCQCWKQSVLLNILFEAGSFLINRNVKRTVFIKTYLDYLCILCKNLIDHKLLNCSEYIFSLFPGGTAWHYCLFTFIGLEKYVYDLMIWYSRYLIPFYEYILDWTYTVKTFCERWLEFYNKWSALLILEKYPEKLKCQIFFFSLFIEKKKMILKHKIRYSVAQMKGCAFSSL